MLVNQIIIDFPEAVDLGDDHRAAVVALAQWIADCWTGAHPGRKMMAVEIGIGTAPGPCAVAADGEVIERAEDLLLVCCEVHALGRALDGVQPSAGEVASALAWGRPVERCRGSYSGPGRVRGWARTAGGEHRVVVAHVIEGGRGELLHIYAPADIRTLPQGEEGE